MSSESTPVRRSHVARGATPAELYAVVTDFEAYPRLFREIKSARVLSQDGNRHRVEFKLEMVVAIRYVLDLVCDPSTHAVDWSYVEGEVVTASSGSWRFVAQADGTRMDYQVALTIKAPLPGFVIKRVTDALVTASLPSMMTSVEKEAAARRARAGSPGGV
jgi:ribosome-associated toxin RatA of RatAB toxin-antitoxin module